jgi:uroporphyrinogen-III synthase
VISYSTSSNSSVLNYDFSAIMFFSPSTVQSFLEKNEPGAMAFCLGKETAIEAGKYFNNVQVANSPDFESLIKLIEINLKKV